jgi:hypothetical protein
MLRWLAAASICDIKLVSSVGALRGAGGWGELAGVDAGGAGTGVWATARLLETVTESVSSTGTNKQAGREFEILPIDDRLNI